MNTKISILNYKHYKTYIYLFNYSNKLYQIINYNILLNFNDGNKICNIIVKSYKEQTYHNIIFNYKNNYGNIILFYDHLIIYNNIQYNYLNKLIIANYTSILININNFTKIENLDVILFNNIEFNENDITNKIKRYKTYEKLNIFSSYDLIIYKQFLKNLKNNNEENNISIPKKKYDLISCHIDYHYSLSLSASYKMTLQIPHLISSIAMAFKNIAKDGMLLLFWTIVNINIPIIKKILSLLVYGFKNVSIIDNDINQNLLIGVPEYYIKCSGYKDNISNVLINKLLDIAIETVDYTYNICDVLDYYEDYTEKHPNHSLFYNKQDEITRSRSTKKTRKSSSTRKLSSTHKSSTRKSSATSKPIKPIYYIEDINIPELDEIMKDSSLQFEVSLLMNKLEEIFVGYFKMVNNLIMNSIATDKNGEMYVKPEAILQKDITNLTKLISMFEYNKLPYNKHALKVLLNKKDEILDHFYSLDTPVYIKLIKYADRTTKTLNRLAISHFKSSKSIKKLYYFDILDNYYNRLKLSHEVKNKLLEDIDFNKYLESAPKTVEYASFDFATGLTDHLNKRYKLLPIKIGSPFVKLWEILNTFNLIPASAVSFKILHLCEAPGEMILCSKYWAEAKCPKLKMEKYKWMANSLNPYNIINKNNKWFLENDKYELIKNNYDKWLWGNDNTGDITNVRNIQSIANEVKEKMLRVKTPNKLTKTVKYDKLDLIISDGSISVNMNALYIQKLELAQVISVIACSSIGGSCCVKHYVPNREFDDNTGNNRIIDNQRDSIRYSTKRSSTNPKPNSKSSDESQELLDNTIIESSSFFVGYLYIYYILFETVSLFKPNSSNPDNGEFYVIGKGFKGINEKQLNNLYDILNNYKLNTPIIDKADIPETFISQINIFLEHMSNTNVISIEKQNLLLTCYTNIGDVIKYQQVNKVLKCDTFFNKNNIDNILVPKYKEWIRLYEFE